ncbi:MAG: NAD(P)H-binding protein [Lachnospiraceae bacterium]
MNIAILGATGLFGGALVKSLLEDTDYNLTLIARHAKDEYQDNERISVINVDATNIDELENALTGTDLVYCAISGENLPLIAINLVEIMPKLGISRLLFMGAVGIYNEIPLDMDDDDNLDNEPAQVPNRKAADIVEASNLNYTVLRPGYLRVGNADDYVLTMKGEPAKGYISTTPSVIEFVKKLIADEKLYSRESVSITKDMEK